MSAFDRLMRHVTSEEEALDPREDLARVRERLQDSVQRLAEPRTWRRPALALAAALVAVTAVVVGWRAFDRESLTYSVGSAGPNGVVGQWIAARSGELRLVFSDGSRVTFARGTRGRVVRTDGSGADLVVESGSVDVEVVHRAGGRWRLIVGPFEVTVTGTRFGLSWLPDEERFELELREGSVTISGCAFGGPQPVRAGETVRASCSSGQFEVVRRQPAHSVPLAPVANPPGATPPAPLPLERAEASPPVKSAQKGEPSRPAAPGSPPEWAAPAKHGPSWRKLVEQKRYEQAVAAAAAVGFEAECERAEAASLISLGDAARFSGQLDKARHAYLTLRRRFPQSGQAGDAAFRLGRMDFDQRRAYREAATWFATYLRERPGSGLAREAQGRLMEALHRGGDQTGARRVASEYLATYPGGPHSKLAAALVQGKNLPE